MTYRIDAHSEPRLVVLTFQGVLDRAALGEIRARCAGLLLGSHPVRLVLLPRTDVESGCVQELARLRGVEVVASDPFLRRWLEAAAGECKEVSR